MPGRLEILNSFLSTEVLIWQEILCSFHSKVEANKQELMQGSEKQKQIQLISIFLLQVSTFQLGQLGICSNWYFKVENI